MAQYHGAAREYILSESTAANRRVYMLLVDATDGITAETGEGGGQPEISKNGGSFTSTSATLTHISDGYYYVELTAGELDTLGTALIRYKSANTIETGVEIAVVERLGDTVFDSTYTTSESFGKRMRALGEPDGTAQGGASTTITLAAAASATDDIYNGQAILVQEGTGAGQSRVVTDYVGATKVATVYPAWTIQPDATSKYVLINALTDVANIRAVPRDVVRDAVTNDVIETAGSVTLQQAMSVILSAVAGRTSNEGNTFSTPDGTLVRITASTDTNNNRTAITITPSS